MKSVVSWAIKNSPAMNIMLIASLLIGAVSMVIMRREVFPNFELEILLVTVPFPGATPDEVEEGICQKIESVVSNVDGVKKMTSVARESAGFVILELNSNVTDVQPVLNDVRSQIDQISSFPPSAEDPEVKQIVFRAPAITVGILGPPLGDSDPLQAELDMREIAEEVRTEITELRAVPPESLVRRALAFMFQPKGAAVSGADIVAEKPYEISVEVSEDQLRRYGLSLEMVADILRRQNIDMPGGKMETASQELLLRGKNKREFGEEIAEIPIRSQSNGDVIRIGDIGHVVDGFASEVSAHIINDRPGIAIRVTKTNTEDLFTIVEAVQQYVDKKQLPEGYTLASWNDISVDVRDRMELLSRNGLQGLILVFLVLAVFLDLRLAFWVAVGIPVSILGAGFVLLVTGNTLNMLTMFAFLMALGIVVDDAIVIGENIYTKRLEGLKFVQAAIEGTVEVMPSVCASVATTIIAFMPLMFVTGVMGKFFAVMPIAVIAMLIISLIESTFILPAHLSHDNNLFLRLVGLVLYVFKPLVAVHSFVNRRATAAMDWCINSAYGPLLKWSLRNKLATLSGALMFGMICLGLVLGKVVPLGFFPDIDGSEIHATLVFPDGTAPSYARLGAMQIQDAVQEVESEHVAAGGKPFIKTLYRRIGEVGNTMQGPTGVTNGSHVSSVEVQLFPTGDRDISNREVISLWREQVPEIAGHEALKFGSESMGPGGNQIEFKILASDKDAYLLDEVADACKVELNKIKGVKDIEDDSRLGKWEMNLRLNNLGKTLGLDENQLAATIRNVYFGSEVMRLQRGRHEVKLMVRYPENERQTMDSFENIRIRDNSGTEWPITEVAEIECRRASSEINRLDQRRSITVTADVDKQQADSVAINYELRTETIPAILEKYQKSRNAALSVNWEGEQAQTLESVISMLIGFGIAVLGMYALLTLQFRSYVQPIIILAIIPFGWLGAIPGHAFVGIELSLFSMFGLIALTGVVVNDSIVLVDFINRRVREGMPLVDALEVSGRRRFRPIMLTSMTTVAGLFPMLLETSLQAQVLIPMAVSLIFGLIAGTFLILFLVPIFYHFYGSILERMRIDLDHDPFDDDERLDLNVASSNSAISRPANPAEAAIASRSVDKLGTAGS